ncbi:MAG TPA: nidogen-like domain-containing protein [Geminicoccaceae bacterium]|nr:nidogen-like domain-containing protein [Geminicoccus sp.]HMU51266.1 nidogen-like domain-containing protein [Geminicoccaceae bacterium]
MATTIGTDANDSLVGTTADDVILGGDGNDEIDGRGGVDTLLGGNGDDSVFGGTGNDVLLGEIGDDQLFGLPGDDELRGGEGADILDGGDGDDLLVGGAGADDMDGGAGNDRYSVDDPGDRISEAPGARLGGIDSVSSSVTFTLPDNVERLTLIGVERINGTGNDLQNRISGNDARNVLRGGGGSDVLAGGLGPDYLDGGAGADTMVGGGDSDTFIVDDEGDIVQDDARGGVADRVIASVDFRLPAHVEQLTLRGTAIDGIGNAFDNVLRGNPLANTLVAGAGADIVLGGSGGDRIIAGAGIDTVDGERGDDIIEGGDDSDTIEGGADDDRIQGDGGGDVLYGDAAEDDPLSPSGDGADALFGGAGFDDLFGGGGNDTLFGGASIDVLDGGAGSDILDGGAGGDFARYEAAAARVVVDLARGIAVSGGDRDTLVSIESVQGSAFNDRIIGNGDANGLTGNGGNDVLIGGIAGVSGGTQVRGDGTMVGGLGGVRGFGENVLDRQDDSPSAQVDIRSVFGSDGISFFGHEFTSVFVNNNGNITFSAAQSTFTPFVITGATSNPIIAPFFADVDTRLPADGSGEPQPPAGADQVFWDLDVGAKTFTVTWDSVGYFNTQTDKLNSFQLQLIDRGGSGDFDIVFRYQSMTWTTGNASGGVDGLGGTVARAGYSSGNGVNFFELPAAGNQAAVLALDSAAGNTGKKGLWVFEVRNGIVAGDRDELYGDAGDDVLVGGLGNDVLAGGEGRDRFDYASRNEGGDSIVDFDPAEDVIDLSRVLSGFVAGASDPEQFLRLVPSLTMDQTQLQVDFDGGGNSFVDFITLSGRTGLSVGGLVGSGAIDLIA